MTVFMLQLNHLATFLLGDAIEVVKDMAHSVDVDISGAEVVLSISGNTPTGVVDRALLRIPNSIDARVLVDNTDRPVSFTATLRDFVLNLWGRDGQVTIMTGDHYSICFVAADPETQEKVLTSVHITQARAERIIPELDYQYRAIIVMPSKNFEYVIEILRKSGDDAVFVDATDVEVEFTTENVEVVYRPEFGECVIAGVHPDHPVSWSFGLHFVDVILLACDLSDTVWLFQSDDAPPMLNFPVGSIANLMLYMH